MCAKQPVRLCLFSIPILQKNAVVVATCSDSGGGYSPQGTVGGVYAQGYKAATGTVRKVLLVNKGMNTTQATVTGARGGSLFMVDETTGDGPPSRSSPGSDTITLLPWAVGVVYLA